MKKIMMLTVPHKHQRYATVGDYQDAHGLTFFTISEMGNPLYEQLVAVHELVEKILCDARGITNESIDQFDIAFEAKRAEGNEDEPGHDPMAPYHKEHVFAEKVERLLAAELGVDWDDYDRIVTEL
jgi:hypothetical protein